MCRVDPDGFYWAFTTSTMRRARKPYKCDECARVIPAGERYHYFSGKNGDSGDMETYRTCEHCCIAAAWLIAACEGYLFTQVLDELVEHWDESPTYQSDTLAGLIAGMRRQWSGGADPLPDEAAVVTSVLLVGAS